jgi:O-methyltransferase/8-demethyl-8-(2,3-dimethoxy-alpha-L-rhamnosyl)tetracenomycin-C 4'-O-methyltransferase
MRGVLNAYGETSRKVFAADTFQGMPADAGTTDAAAFLAAEPAFAVSLDDVKAAFHRHGLLDDGVVFLQGDFAATLPHAPTNRLAILRLDGDTFRSAMTTLAALYDKVSRGGSVIVDDYFLFDDYRRAVDAFRTDRSIADPIVRIDAYGGYWIKDVRAHARGRTT